MSPLDGKYICTEHMMIAMKDAEMRHQDLAAAIGVSGPTISRIKHRLVPVSDERLSKIAEALNVTEEYLLNPPMWVVAPDHKTIICSMCKCERPMHKVMTPDGMKARNWASPYCPQCGNRMGNGKEKTYE